MGRQEAAALVLCKLTSHGACCKCSFCSVSAVGPRDDSEVPRPFKLGQAGACSAGSKEHAFVDLTLLRVAVLCICSWVKGWFRSAKALQGLGNLEFAVQAAEKAQQLEPSNKDVGNCRRCCVGTQFGVAVPKSARCSSSCN